jgi:hypothetical protein
LSIDRAFRKLGLSYWLEEVPNYEEICEAKRNLEKHGNSVDFVVTHTLPTLIKELMGFPVKDSDDDKVFTDFLDEVRMNVSYKKWFAGHFHMDKYATDSGDIRILYQSTVSL